MKCDFLDYTGGILWGSHECKLTEKKVDNNTIDTYCDNSLKYKECPIYKEKTSSNPPCYLTTAMCNILGYEDDCFILNTLRNFREFYMKSSEEGLTLLDDYNTVGPIIAKNLENDKDNTFKAKIMLYFYILPAINSMKKDNYDEAIELYKDMTINLMHTYNIERNLLKSEKIIGSSTTRKRELVKV